MRQQNLNVKLGRKNLNQNILYEYFSIKEETNIGILVRGMMGKTSSK